MRCLLYTLAMVLAAGCRSQTTAMTNPFLAPNRVPPPATRTLLPGTAQPYYPGDPLPNSPAIGAPPAGWQQTAPTSAPPPAGTVPPGGWDGAAQPIPGGSSSYDVLPNGFPGAVATVPVSGPAPVHVPSDQQSLRFAAAAAPIQQPMAPAAIAPALTLPPDPSVLPTPQQSVSPYPNRLASYQVPLAQPQAVPQSMPSGQPRQVRIRAIATDNSTTAGDQPRSSDGFRPQGGSQAWKPTLMSRLMPRRREPVSEASARFGFDPQYGWLRGQLQVSAATGEWAVRYLPTGESLGPLGDQVDRQFGGSLTIANPEVLGNLQRGDYVQLRGRVERPLPGGTPVYKVLVVQRQRI